MRLIVKKKYWFVVAILFIVLLLLWQSLQQSNTVEFQVFKLQSQGDYFYKLLRFIPSAFKDRYRISELDKISDEIQLLSVTDKSSPTEMNFVVLKADNKIQFIKAYPYMLNKDLDISLKNYAENSIDINAFNSYTSHYRLTRKQAMEKYCYFLSAINFKKSYLILETRSQIDSLITSKERMDNFIKYYPSANLIQPDEIQLGKSDDQIICWFIDKGVVKIHFKFSSSNLIKEVDSELVGFLGIESPSI